jgi:hypothetical protein
MALVSDQYDFTISLLHLDEKFSSFEIWRRAGRRCSDADGRAWVRSILAELKRKSGRKILKFKKRSGAP